MSVNPPLLQARPSERRGLAIAHIVIGCLWIPVGIVVSYLLTAMIVISSTREGPSGLETNPVTLLESQPGVAMIFVALFTLLPAALLITSGVCILRSLARWLTLTVAWLSCLFIPIGTVLGIWTLITLRRKKVGTES